MTTIYKLLDPVTRDVRYVGQTIHPDKRRNQHMKPEFHRDDPLARWVRDLGKQNLRPDFVVMQEVPKKIADDVELFWINKFKKRGYPLLNTYGVKYA